MIAKMNEISVKGECKIFVIRHPPKHFVGYWIAKLSRLIREIVAPLQGYRCLFNSNYRKTKGNYGIEGYGHSRTTLTKASTE